MAWMKQDYKYYKEDKMAFGAYGRPTNYGGFSERAFLEASLFRQPYVIRQNSLPALARNWNLISSIPDFLCIELNVVDLSENIDAICYEYSDNTLLEKDV